MKGFNVTYEIITQESAEYGDAEERGFLAEGVSLREAVREVTGSSSYYKGYSAEPNDSCIDSARWITFYDVTNGTREYYETGNEESRSIHFPDSITPSSRRRICRLFQ